MDKSPDAFRTISEVADHLDTPAHVLRFWESRFPQIRPVKRAGGRRYYRPSDVALLQGIRRLLHDEGMTIRGVQKVLREQGVRHVAALSGADIAEEAPSAAPGAAEVAQAAPAAFEPAPADATAAGPPPAADLPPFAAPPPPAPPAEPTETFAARLRAIAPSTIRARGAALAPAVARLAALRDRMAERGRVPRR